MSESGCGLERRNEGSCSRKDTELSKRPGVKASERRPRTDCCRETELEHNYRRDEGAIQRCCTSGWQHFHPSNQTTHPLQFHSLSLTASCSPGLVSVCCPLHPHYLPTLPPFIPSPGFFCMKPRAHTHTYCTRTRSLCLTVSVFLSGG